MPGNDRETRGSEARIGAQRDPEGRREKGHRVARWAAAEHGEREGNTAHPSRVRVAAVPQEHRGPASQGSPRTRGSFARPFHGEWPSMAQGDRTKLPRHPAHLRPAGTRRYQDTETPRHGNSEPPHLNAAEPPLPDRKSVV